jgi:hypothetical protein
MSTSLLEVWLLLQPRESKIILPTVRALHVSLLQSPITSAIVESLHVSTRILSVHVTQANIDGFWQFLNVLSKHSRTLSLRTIKVTSFLTHPRDFSWNFGNADLMNVSRESAEFVGRMFGFATRLAERGVSIMDESGVGFARRKLPAAGA